MSRFLVVLAILGCSAKPDRKAECHKVVDHIRDVSMTPLRETDVVMVMGACEMWPAATRNCVLAAKDDAGIAVCRAMDR